MITDAKLPVGVGNDATETISPAALQAEFDAVVLAGGASTRVICRCLAANFPACTTQWNSCRYRTR
jgi:hypothetical protein